MAVAATGRTGRHHSGSDDHQNHQEESMGWKLVAIALGGALTASLLFPQGSADRQRGQDPEQEKIERLKKEQADRDAHRLAGNVETLRRMQGGWQMVELRAPDLPDAGRDDAAFMLVSSEFLAIEIHTAYFDEAGEELESFFQTGIYRLNFNVYGDLTATVLIGSVDSGEGLTVPQIPGRISVYAVEVKEGSLILTAEDGTRFTFERMATGQLTLRVFEDTSWLPGAKKPEVKAEVDIEEKETSGGDGDD